jgi:hypothetical protein
VRARRLLEHAVQREPARMPEDHARSLVLEVQQIEALGQLAMILVRNHEVTPSHP